MLNPLALPAAAIEALVELPRLIGALTEANVLLARAVDAAERLDAKTDRIVASLEDSERVADKLTASGDKLVEASARAEEFSDKLLASAEKLVESSAAARDEARAATEALQASRPTVEALAELGQPILEASVRAQEQLGATQVELAAGKRADGPDHRDGRPARAGGRARRQGRLAPAPRLSAGPQRRLEGSGSRPSSRR